jgi:hypothetical protein
VTEEACGGFGAVRRVILELEVDGTMAAVIVDGPPDISELNMTGTVTVVFDLFQVVLCDIAGGIVGV